MRAWNLHNNSEKNENKTGIFKSTEELAQSFFHLLKAEVERLSKIYIVKTIGFLALSVLATVALVFLTVSLIVWLNQVHAVEYYVSALVASVFFILVFFALFYLMNKKTEYQPEVNEKLFYARQEVDENLNDVKEKAKEKLESISPSSIVKNNPEAAMIGTFIAGLGLALWKSKK